MTKHGDDDGLVVESNASNCPHALSIQVPLVERHRPIGQPIALEQDVADAPALAHRLDVSVI